MAFGICGGRESARQRGDRLKEGESEVGVSERWRSSREVVEGFWWRGLSACASRLGLRGRWTQR
eukprot:1940374-Pleurochrysis_carterae.AAC.2